MNEYCLFCQKKTSLRIGPLTSLAQHIASALVANKYLLFEEKKLTTHFLAPWLPTRQQVTQTAIFFGSFYGTSLGWNAVVQSKPLTNRIQFNCHII
jgi:hypothetical protein